LQEDDDDLDLFGDETEEEKAAAEAREAEKKKSTKPKVIGKSSIVMDVKPWDDETDMVKLEECVRAVQMEGLHWGACKSQQNTSFLCETEHQVYMICR
jgi:elongation factor 1-beta